MPMISPSQSARAPPELPGEIAASVWIRSVRARLAAVPLPVSSGGELAAHAAHHARGDGRLEARRAAYGYRELADDGGVSLERGCRQVIAVHLYHGYLGVRIGADNARVFDGAVGEGHVHVGGTFDDVVVGDDVAVLAIDHTAPYPLALLGPERRLSHRPDVDLHHAWPHPRGDPGHGLVGRDGNLRRGLCRVVRLRAWFFLGTPRKQDRTQHEGERGGDRCRSRFQCSGTSCRRQGRVVHHRVYTRSVQNGCTLYPLRMDASTNRREVPADLARAGEARYFIAWRGAVAGLGGGRLNDLAVAAEAVVTDILLSAREGVLEIESEHDEEVFRIFIKHPEIKQRRLKDLERVLERFVDDYEITATRAMLVKRLR